MYLRERIKMSSVNSINVSDRKGISKNNVDKATLVEGLGLEGDAHAAPGNRQVSLLALESIKKQKECVKVKKPDFTLNPGDFAENITTEGIDLVSLKIDNTIKIGETAVLRISKIGKECHRYCAIYHKIGDCIMPREGIFGEVVVGGEIKVGDKIVRTR